MLQVARRHDELSVVDVLLRPPHRQQRKALRKDRVQCAEAQRGCGWEEGGAAACVIRAGRAASTHTCKQPRALRQLPADDDRSGMMLPAHAGQGIPLSV